MFLGKTRRIHFIGIGGSGMSGIAEVLANQGYEVSGSDQTPTRITDYLEQLGVVVHFGHEERNVKDSQVVVTSSAIKADNVEVVAAKLKRIPVIPRAEMLAELMRMKEGIAIAGTHGKTTTTSLVATVMAEGGLDPTAVIGGLLKSIGSHAKLGQSEFLVAEADESDGSFLKLFPTIAVITTLDEEHLDHYRTFERMKDAFVQFANQIPFYGSVVLCLDDIHLQSLLPRLEKRRITYGLTSQADYIAKRITIDGLDTWFDVYFQNECLGRIHSVAPGRHNVLNTLAAVAVGMELNLTFDSIAQALKTFQGVQRRFEILHSSKELVVVDDYGHHPAEIEVTLKTAKEVWPDQRLIVVFQPHRFSRTKSLFADFLSSFNDADVLIVLDIYAAGESPIEGVSGKTLAAGIGELGHKSVTFLEGVVEAKEFLQQNRAEGDVILTLGAGNVWEVSRDLVSKLQTEHS